ncbi:SGNH/GDSL hydrolase family protein [Massilia terrae]|uniref:SGNH/GDSL hydrolase family protein n=1 Tax=Massilia terrae TaxID=1811224 RepID=A0ABT2CX45_9BURK|nr:SGNH/GDSL hydrolase family protein [Massilia terrae]MCS0658532.1 SGNH/GDSL hydrolase family protein [Massilia terrae]
MRAGLARGLAALAAAALLSTASAQQPASSWVGTWGTAAGGPALPAQQHVFDGQTVRLVVHTSIGGARVRIRLSNELGAQPLRIGAAHIALRKHGADTVPGTDRVLTFGGLASATIPPGAPLLSDPVELDVPALADLAVSLYLPGRAEAATVHEWAAQTSYVSGPGDFTGTASLPRSQAIGYWPFLTEVDVEAPGAGAVVALGDSITEASLTARDANHRWTDLLALRLQRAPGDRIGVVNRGVSGNRMLRDPGEQPLFGKALLARFDRDALASAGARYLVVLIGINDIGHPGMGAIPLAETPAPQDLIAGYRQLIARAHAKGLAVYGATLPPFEGTTFAKFYTRDKAAVRDAVNQWIRGSGEFDGVIDFDRALRDPDHPTRLLSKYDSGDHLHPNDAGNQAMADAIPLELFHSAAAPRP